MTKQEITQKVIQLAAAQVGVDPATVSPETHFINDLNYDSLDQVEFAMEAEDEFEFSVPDEDAEKFDTVGSVIDYVEKRASRPEEVRSGNG
jgi:acyl carrier protein